MAEITSPSLTATLCDHEHRAWSALCTSGAALLPLLSPNPVMIFPGGVVLTATSTPSLQGSLKEGTFTPWESYTLSHDESVPVGDSSGIVWYKVEAKRQGVVFKAVCSSVWTREEQTWKMVSHQQTLID
ncbi:hypothetical protein K491DRAFT_607491 [Lophiostoma macrostomum CBS 122681]|uniref:DUF4440 domain-containing protein n=1 Tax=Lophiostoma macrostomum CBS 122681 TaxID=1314788 RepID=A0A6A6SVZ8_9PLEO|nr:hypothetical protein K491DRAFT_607491 [Lophiostoma macrostomum CBS 122681]